MCLARMIFHGKDGHIGELLDVAKRVSELMSAESMPRSRLLTNASGRFDTVAFEYEADSIDGTIEQSRSGTSNQELRGLFQRMTELTDHGSREYYKIKA